MALAHLDVFTKVEDEFLGRSASGGCISITIWLTLALLSFIEVSNFLVAVQTHEFVVESPMVRSTTIYLDITVAMACKYVALSVVDQAGVASDYGNSITMKDTKFNTANTHLHLRDEPTKADFAQDEAAGGFIELLSQLTSPKRSDPQHTSTSACRLNGRMVLTQRPASFNIVPKSGGFFGSETPTSMRNLSHRIDALSFGLEFPHLGIFNPLKGSLEVSMLHFEMYQYFVSVVPTTVHRGNRVYQTSQFAVTDYKKSLKGFDFFSEQGLFFKLAYEPIAVVITEESPESFFRFCVRLCGIIGGVYVSVGILHSAASSAYRFATSTASRRVRM